MPKLSQDAIRELRQSLPLLERLYKVFSDPAELFSLTEFEQLEKAYNRLSELTSPDQVRTWVGPPFEVRASREVEQPELSKFELTKRFQAWRGIAQRLYLYVRGILDNEKVERTLDYLIKENNNLREQLAELRQRESTYLSTIKQVPPRSREILLESLKRQYTTLVKNLTRLQEAKAQYGLNVPLDILNAIDQTQQDLKQIEATIADLKASKTDTNRKT